MERLKRVLTKLLFPHPLVMLVSVPVAAVLLINTFLSGAEDSPIAYVAYGFSAWSFTAICARIAVNMGNTRNKIQSVIHRNRLVHRYVTDVSFKLHVSLYLSLGINFIYAVMNFFCGLYYRSVWFGTLAVYYIALAVMRFLLLRHANRNAFGEDMESELRRYRLCGVIFLLMNTALSGVTILVITENDGFEYAGYLIYAIALYAFYNIITAVINVIKYRKYNSPVMSAAKIIKLAAALVSMLSLETAMLTQFGDEDRPEFRQFMTGITGSCVCLIVLVIAIIMILWSTAKLRELESKETEVSS